MSFDENIPGKCPRRMGGNPITRQLSPVKGVLSIALEARRRRRQIPIMKQ
jgi:hypothetical protein